MSPGVIRLSSVTYAIRAQKLLEQQGIRSYVKRVTSTTQANGCGYGLEINGNLEAAQRIITASGIRIVEIMTGV